MASSTQRLDSFARNLAIGGNMDFWQRGTSFATANGYTADRWTVLQGGYTGTVTRSTDVPTQAQSGFNSQYSLLLTNGTGASPGTSNYQQIGYKMEGFDYQNLHARKGRIQFWVKSSVAGTFPAALLGASRSYVTSFTVTSAGVWQKIVLDVAFDTSATGWNFDNTAGLTLYISPTIGTNNQTSTLNTWAAGTSSQGITGQTQWGATTGATFQIAQFMIIPEDLSASPNVDIAFQRAGRTIQHELALCQRYYEFGLLENYLSNGSTGYCGASVPYAVDKRAAATISTVDGSGNPGKLTIISNASGNQIANNSYITHQNNTRLFVNLYVGGATNFGIIYNWTADAEL